MHTETIARSSFFSGLISTQKEWIKIVRIDDVNINEMIPLKLKGRSIILCRAEQGFFALQNRCTYGKYQLSEGVMIKSTIQCLKHGCQYSVLSGKVKKGPAGKQLKTYRTLLKDGYVCIEV